MLLRSYISYSLDSFKKKELPIPVFFFCAEGLSP
jgi:hypothetical protein